MRKYNLRRRLLPESINTATLSAAGKKALEGIKRQVGGGKAQKAVAAAIVGFGKQYALTDCDIVPTSSHNTDVYVDAAGEKVPCEAKANSGTFDISRFLAAADPKLKPKGKSKRKSYANHAKYNKASSPPPAPSALVQSSAAKIIALDEFICITDSGLTEMYAVYVPECQEHGAAGRNSAPTQTAIKTKLFGTEASKIPNVSASTIASQLSGAWRYVEKNKNGKKTWSWRFELAITKSILENLGAKRIDLGSIGVNEISIHIDFFTSYVTTNQAQIDARKKLATLCGTTEANLTNLALTFDANGSSALQSIYHKSSKRYLPVVLNPDTYPTYGAAFSAALAGFEALAKSPGFTTSSAPPASSSSALSNAGVSPQAEEEVADAVVAGRIEHEGDWESTLTDMTKKELLKVARNLQITGRYGMNKPELFEKIKSEIAALIKSNDTERIKELSESNEVDINVFKLALAEAVIESDKKVVGIDIPTVVAAIKKVYLDDNKDLTSAPKGAYGSIKKMLGDKTLKIDGNPMNRSFSRNLRKMGKPNEYDAPDFDLDRFSESKYSLKHRLFESPLMDMEYVDDVNMPDDNESLENMDPETKEILGDVILDGIIDGTVSFI